MLNECRTEHHTPETVVSLAVSSPDHRHNHSDQFSSGELRSYTASSAMSFGMGEGATSTVELESTAATTRYTPMEQTISAFVCQLTDLTTDLVEHPENTGEPANL